MGKKKMWGDPSFYKDDKKIKPGNKPIKILKPKGIILTIESTPSPTASPIESLAKPPNKSPDKPLTKSLIKPTKSPAKPPTKNPAKPRTKSPTASRTKSPAKPPTKRPADPPTKNPAASPTKSLTASPTKSVTASSTKSLTTSPTKSLTASPTKSPAKPPTKSPTEPQTKSPVESPAKRSAELLATSLTEPPTKSSTTSPTTESINIAFSPFTLEIITTSSVNSLIEDGKFSHLSRKYLQNFYREFLDKSVGFRRISFFVKCQNQSTNAIASTYKCIFEMGNVWVDSIGSIPPKHVLDEINERAFRGENLFDYLSVLHQTNDQNLLGIASVVLSETAEEVGKENRQGVDESISYYRPKTVKLEGMYTFVAASFSLAAGGIIAFVVVGSTRRRTLVHEYPEIFIDASDDRYMDNMSEMSLSVISKTHDMV
mmetsp:Transcript_14635/g.29258  ORF Transcript_14635/g.29258 Transcript_14635/m.29258 type:complete len:429 (+) Transcript_14635:601-1887(+)